MTLLSIPSPSQGTWHLGPFPVRAYALCIIAGVIAAIWVAEKRWVARGGKSGQVSDLALWMVPFGLVGGRLYHVMTDWHLYFAEGQEPITALYVWRGGLGIWGAISLGALGLFIGARRMGIKLAPVADAIAPAVLIGQALGRFGNYFNQELFGRPTDLPWALEIDPAHRPSGYLDQTTFHPTFLYEALWCLAAFAVIVWVDKRAQLGHGRVVALYVMVYTMGRGWIETLRIDDVQLDDVLGLRLNVWTSLLLFTAAAAYFLISSSRHPGRETAVYRDGWGPDGRLAPDTDEPAEPDDTQEATEEPVEETGDDTSGADDTGTGSGNGKVQA